MVMPGSSEGMNYGPILLAGLAEAVVALDARRAVREWNPAMERLSGVARAAALGRGAEAVLPLLREPALAASLREALAGETPAAVELPHGAPADEGPRWLEARCLPLRGRGGAPAGALVLLADVTERYRRALVFQAIEAIGQSLTSSLDLNEALDTIVGKACEVMGADAALVVSWDGKASEFKVMRATGRLSREYAAAGAIPVGGGPISRAIIEARPVATSNILTDAQVWLSPERRTDVAREGFKASAAAPLVSKGRVHGALAVHYWAERTFGAEELDALALLAEQAAIAIDNARLYADATRRAERLRELAALEQLVAGSLDLDVVLRRIAEACARLLDAPVVQVWMLDAAARTLRRHAMSVQEGGVEPGVPSAIAVGEGIAGRAFESRMPIYVPEITEDPRVIAPDWAIQRGLGALLAVPMLSGDDVFGVFTIHAPAGAVGVEEDRTLAASLAAQAAIAIQNARLYAEAVGRAGQLRELVAVSRSISALELDELLGRIARAAADLTGTRFGTFWVADERERTLTFMASSLPGTMEEYTPRVLPYDAGGVGWVARHRAPLVVDDYLSDPRLVNRAWVERWDVRGFAAFPVLAGDELLAVLALGDSAPIRLSEDTQRSVEMFLAQAAVAIRNAHLYRAANRRRELAEVLARLARELTATLDSERIATLLAEGVAAPFGARFAGVYWHEPEDGSLRCLTAVGTDADVIRGLTLHPGEGVGGRCVAERTVVATRDILAEPGVTLSPALRERIAASGYRGAVGVPLLTHERIIGALVLGAVPGWALSADERQALEAVADQAALAFDNARLYAQARESVGRLRETQAQLVQAAKMSALGQLVSGVAHELNNPLSVIIGYGQLLLARELPAVTRRPVELMVSQADRMAKIVKNLLLFSRQRPPERVAVNLNDVIERTLAFRLNQLAVAGIEVERAYHPALPPIAGDNHQLEQVFLNLLLNAEQAILEGGRLHGRITLRTGVGDNGQLVRAQVVDNGPGISPDVLPRVFEPFFTTKDVGAGTGLGLSVSYGIVAEHGGRLFAESRPGETLFTLEFPAASPEDLLLWEGALPTQVVAGAGRHALVVEDEPAVLDLVVTLLGQTGWRVDVASGGRAALERVRQQSYDLIVSDIRMPEGGGEEFYRTAIMHEPALRRRFLFITGDTATRHAWHFLSESEVPIIEKPFQPALFLDAVRRVTTALTPSAPQR
jgi:PAS domain S-box-containing protein